MQRVPLQIERQIPPKPEESPFLADEYLPACYEGVGIWQASNGAKLYEHFVRSYTTTKLTPDDVHALGLREVVPIRDEMHSTQKKVGFSGTLAEFFTFLRSDPKFFYGTGEELLDG